MDPFKYFFHVCLCYAVLYVPYSFMITCWKRDDLLALLYEVFPCVIVHFSTWWSGSGMVLDCIDS